MWHDRNRIRSFQAVPAERGLQSTDWEKKANRSRIWRYIDMSAKFIKPRFIQSKANLHQWTGIDFWINSTIKFSFVIGGNIFPIGKYRLLYCRWTFGFKFFNKRFEFLANATSKIPRKDAHMHISTQSSIYIRVTTLKSRLHISMNIRIHRCEQ